MAWISCPGSVFQPLRHALERAAEVGIARILPFIDKHHWLTSKDAVFHSGRPLNDGNSSHSQGLPVAIAVDARACR
eukprot:scaffold21153_cov33-Phaeocystis_antarctica.AAC.4